MTHKAGEMKRVKLQSNDGDIFEIEPEMINMCTTVKNMLRGKTAFRNSLGGQFSIDGSYVILKKEGRVLATLTKNTEEEAIITLPDVKTCTLEKVIDYCKYHSDSSIATDREKRSWDSEFVQVKQSVLCELASASYYLDIKPLVNLTSRAIATQISGKTSEEIRETFCNLNSDVYAPLFATTLATRCRLQRKMNQKKQQDKEAKSLEQKDDNRSVEELLSFINDDGSKKKKNKKKKSKTKETKPIDVTKEERKDAASSDTENQDISSPLSTSSSSSQAAQEDEVEDQDLETKDWENERISQEDIDPELQAQLDKEVEEFRQRLEMVNSKQKNSPKIQLPMSAALFVSSLVGVH